MYTASTGEDTRDNVVLLQTFRAWVIADDRSVYIRGIFDGGSQKTFIRQDISRKLKLQVLGEIVVRLNTFGDATGSETAHRHRLVQVRLRSQYDEKEYLLEAVDIPFISKDIVAASVNDSFVAAVKAEGGCIADEVFFAGVVAQPGIGLLVAADQMWRLLKTEVRRSAGSESTVAVNTHLGWTFQGPSLLKTSVTKGMNALTCVLHVQATTEGHCLDIRKLWDLESLGIIDDTSDKRLEDDVTLRDFDSTVEDKDGRYQVGLSWKADSTYLGDNRKVAERRLESLVKRLRSNESQLLCYDEAMRNYLIHGHAEVVSEDECTSAEHVYYMPHQAVFGEDSATTKLIVVFDASSRAPDTASLNECLEKGPKLNAELLPLLLRFRTERIAIAADIAKAFVQVLVREEDRDALRFLWFQETPLVDGPLPEIQIWRMTRVPFGTTSSPFLLSATIQHHLKRVEGPLKETAEKLRECFSVDDLLTGASTEAEAERLYTEANTIMQLAGMDLRKWASSSAVLSQRFQEHDDRCPGGYYAATTELGLLGLLWDRETDQLKLSQQLEPVFKREHETRGTEGLRHRL
ncbi:uncharacterized protein LOC135372610 [Ornithodoros turicata]|uniref:uncharacterized protein LOC135372610 n=1 Tax=Ornithodoros turicata TaxID=34597 RepID=UPI003139300F